MPMPVMQPRYSSPAATYPSPNHDLARWHDPAVTGPFADGTTQAVHPYAMMASQPPPPPQQYAQPSTPNGTTALARRHMNRALVPTTAAHPHFDDAEAWPFNTNDPATLLDQTTNGGLSEQSSIEALEELAIKAKREAQAKRKQIPPFVQKLSSFLDEEKNVDLIRWSDKGDSFVVLDEDEFAKTLIPELFKHNNYASFVRQLNMYGFHKRVGLSDNSMRASERKNKSPSEYSNPYFRRGHPNLLWLINKPKSGSKGKSKGGQKPPENDAETDEEAGVEEVGQSIGGGSQSGRALPSGNMPLDRKEIALVREELAKVREQQKMILNAISRIQRDNSTLYQQAVIFQEQHDRHQNSINAILNFLANVFRKTLEDQNSQNVNELLANIMPGNGNNSIPQGSVVDLGDFVSSQVSGASPVSGPKRARGLLPPIPVNGVNAGSSRASMASSSSSGKATPSPYHSHANSVSGTVTELFDHLDGAETASPAASDLLAQELKSNPRESMMKIIQDTNASRSAGGGAGGAGGGGGGLDLPEVVANAPATMTNDQREQMLNNMIAQTQGPEAGTAPVPNSTAAAATAAAAPTASNTSGASFPNIPAPTSTTAGHAPVPAHSPAPGLGGGGGGGSKPAPPANANFSLSPVMNANPLPPSLNHISNTSGELDTLHRMTQDSNERLANIQHILSPLSPSGRIPGLDDMENAGGYFENHNLDLDHFLDTDAFDPNNTFSHMDFNAGAAGAAGGEFDFGILHDHTAAAAVDPTAGGHPPAGDNPSPSGTEEIPRADEFGLAGNSGRPRDTKRRRVG
ncbi:hypothetical protein SODALDRAFT_319793 [Sodiomyces alkalinus F11]|uniref:HSF-type DNA-binding domain-containing protein n=1 Tax=Sodiomyces alkalinus (strain CBS 110278 / VKM F-3762 / F11) TaxID=1314773 RepID=A0A3N2Q9C4_SODAK|nr:hypothetical protein SODALDRAFT_319793 [Sodiomyces alkalinus F11]ROT43307.1 hypothetical protein SODALDRAFT_319793 [Sodiomyces alkalinus F11]